MDDAHELTPDPPAQLRTHLADFETTTADLLRTREARALLNFAALFHEIIYLTDTALGDHQLLINSFREDPHGGLFSHVARLVEAGILRALCRDTVVVRDKVLVDRNPTIRQIFEGWQYRDRVEWAGDTGFTTVVDAQTRLAYCREVDELLARCNAIQRYDPDIPKAAFRERVRDLLNSDQPSMLSRSLAVLPKELRYEYMTATEDPWFTNAELWRVLRRNEGAREVVILQAHINQQCFADLTQSGQSAQDRSKTSLASFNLELQRERPMALDVDATLEPPDSLDELLERAAVRLNSPGVEMFEHLTVEQIVALRRRAVGIFSLAQRRVALHELEGLRREYLRALEQYWGLILETFATAFPDRMKHPSRLGLFAEEQLPTLGRLYEKFRGVFVILLRIGLSSASPAAGGATGPATDVAHRIGVAILHEQTHEAALLRGSIPPAEWRPRGILGLERAIGKDMDRPPPKALLLDLDDTILDDSGNVTSAWQRACATHATECGATGPVAILKAIDRVREWFWSDPERHRVGRLDLGEARHQIVERALADLGVRRPGLAARIGDTYGEAREAEIQPLAGAIDTLGWLRSQGCRLALLTNGGAVVQRRKIDRFNLATFFEQVLIEGELGFGKPDPRVYELALVRMAVAPSDTWMVGDNLEWDVAEPQRQGMCGVWVDRNGQGLPATSGIRPDKVVRKLSDLRDEWPTTS